MNPNIKKKWLIPFLTKIVQLYYSVYFDNFFTIPMISKLLEYWIFAYGTFKTNKMFHSKMKKDNKYVSGDRVCSMQWY